MSLLGSLVLCSSGCPWTCSHQTKVALVGPYLGTKWIHIGFICDRASSSTIQSNCASNRQHSRVRTNCRFLIAQCHAPSTSCPGVQLHSADEHGFAKGISVDGLTFASGNFVAHSGMVGQVLFCRMVGEDGWLVVRLCGRPSTRDMERKTTEWCMAVTLHPSSVAEWEVTACDRALGSKQFGDNFLVLSQP